MSFSANLKIGKLGESVIARWLIARGHSILPAYEIEMGQGKGPQLYCAEMSFVVPDLFVFGEKFFWVEAKNKSAFTWHRLTQRWVTGIDLNHYEEYRTVQEVTKCHVWLFFLQNKGQAKDSDQSPYTGLYAASLNKLFKSENHRHANGGKYGMVYWAPVEEGGPLFKFAELNEVL